MHESQEIHKILTKKLGIAKTTIDHHIPVYVDSNKNTRKSLNGVFVYFVYSVVEIMSALPFYGSFNCMKTKLIWESENENRKIVFSLSCPLHCRMLLNCLKTRILATKENTDGFHIKNSFSNRLISRNAFLRTLISFSVQFISADWF